VRLIAEVTPNEDLSVNKGIVGEFPLALSAPMAGRVVPVYALALLCCTASALHLPTRPPLTCTAPRCAVCASAAGHEEGRKINREMFAIGAPALVGLAIEPVASLVDTAFVGRCCGASQLAGVGLAVAIFNLVSKAFNFLSPATTSLVAAASPDNAPGEFTEPMVRATSASLSIAAVLGLAVAAVLTCGANPILGSLLGLLATDPVRASARAYLIFRGLAAPAGLAMLCMQVRTMRAYPATSEGHTRHGTRPYTHTIRAVVFVFVIPQGAFRGARDTKTPLLALAVSTVVNVALDAAFIPKRVLGMLSVVCVMCVCVSECMCVCVYRYIYLCSR